MSLPGAHHTHAHCWRAAITSTSVAAGKTLSGSTGSHLGAAAAAGLPGRWHLATAGGDLGCEQRRRRAWAGGRGLACWLTYARRAGLKRR
jgi:hypothetical protein